MNDYCFRHYPHVQCAGICKECDKDKEREQAAFQRGMEEAAKIVKKCDLESQSQARIAAKRIRAKMKADE